MAGTEHFPHPYADFTYFGLLLYIVLPTILLGLFGWANRHWTIATVVIVSVVQFSDLLPVFPNTPVWELWIVVGYGLLQAGLAWGLLRWRLRPLFWVFLVLSLLPLVAVKVLPVLRPGSLFGFLGISYVTFRALDVLFSIHDGVLKTLSPGTYFTYLFFWPTVSSGPVDRYRRFEKDLNRQRSRTEFLDDFNVAVDLVFRGFLYKFIIAALIRTYWMDRMDLHQDASHVIGYMYGYSLYLFFDFAGYSSFAIGVGRVFGIQSPANFDLPFLARNIRDFWNRWHISLSFWFRDHIYMRFVIAATKGNWFKGKYTASYLGLFLTFGIMGVWHGVEPHYLIYGCYHAILLCGYDAFARWNKQAKRIPDTRGWRIANTLITAHVVCFGLLIFSGKLGSRPVVNPPKPPPPVVAEPPK